MYVAPILAGRGGALRGFDDEFTDIVDYILRITQRIWEGKQVGLCRDYYAERLGGLIAQFWISQSLVQLRHLGLVDFGDIGVNVRDVLGRLFHRRGQNDASSPRTARVPCPIEGLASHKSMDGW